MASIDITAQSGAVGNGDLQLQNGAPMDGTLRFVTDALNTASPLKLSTSLVQTTSTLKITTADNPYIDAEDNSGNNRFTVGRDPASQQVNVDFASNPTGSTTIVGAIRTYVDGVNLSEIMAFREDGNIGINTLTPGAKLDVHSGANVVAQFNRTGTGKSWIQYLQAGSAKWNTGYDNTNGNFTIYDAIGATDRMVVTNGGNVGIGTTAPGEKLEVSGSNVMVKINADVNSFAQLGFYEAGSLKWNTYNDFSNDNYSVGNSGGTRFAITAAGNVGIGTTSPFSKLHVLGSEAGASPSALVRVGNNGAGYMARVILTDETTADGNIVFQGSAAGSSSQYIGFGVSAFDTVKVTGDNYLRMASGTGGIQFNGDTAAANALDDYEEGTWTPVYRQGGVSNTATYSYQTGTYTKIGNLVTAFFDIDASSITAGVGACEIAGLPFTISTTMAGYSYVPFRDPSALSTILTNAIGIGFAQRNTDYILVRELDTITGQEGAITSWFTSGRMTGVLQYTV